MRSPETLHDPVEDRAAEGEGGRRRPGAEAAWIAVVGLLGAAYLVAALALPAGSLDRPDVGFFPRLIGVLLVASAVAALIQTLLGHSVPEGERAEGGAFWRVPTILAGLVVHLLVAERIGHLLATAGLSALVIGILGRHRPWWQVALLALLLALGSSFIFENLLNMQLPRGRLPFLGA